MLEGAVQCGFCIPGHHRARRVADRARADRRSRRRSPSRSTAICAAAPGTAGSSTRFRRRAKRCGTAGCLPADRAAAASLFRRRSRAEPQPGVCSRRNGNGNGNGHRRRHIGLGRDRAATVEGRCRSSTSRLDGMEQALGEKPFVDDLRVPGMLHGAMVLTEHPRARILKIHTRSRPRPCPASCGSSRRPTCPAAAAPASTIRISRCSWPKAR